jgi:hypothetical protein
MRAIRALALASSLPMLVLPAVTAAAQETLLQNDGYVDGQAVAFQAGFVAAEMAGSRFVPAGAGPWRVNRVRFLLGGATSTQTITLHVYDDAAGTAAPGAELFEGDFAVTGSNNAMQEINLISNNIQVTGPFRVAIDFQHTGLPSVASDLDGTIDATRNFIFSPSFPGWLPSNLLGLTGDWIIRAGVEQVALDYFTLAPCRVVDTRGSAPIGGPVLQGQETRSLALAGHCGIPATAKAISINIAVTGATASGHVRLFPAGQAVPAVSAINYSAGQTRANNAIIQLNASGALAAFIGQAAGTTVHLIIDVNGYFE